MQLSQLSQSPQPPQSPQSTFYQKQLELVNEVGDSIVCLRHLLGDPGEPIPTYFLKPDCEEYYRCCSEQVTMHPRYSQSLDEILNDAGKELYQKIKEKANNTIPKKEFEMYCIIPVRSGSWFSDQTSKYHGGVKATFNSFENLAVWGKSENDYYQTSPCFFINVNEGWCYTKSGSFYKLKSELSYCEFHKIIQENQEKNLKK